MKESFEKMHYCTTFKTIFCHAYRLSPFNQADPTIFEKGEKEREIQAVGFDWPHVLKIKERSFVCRAKRLMMVKCYDNKNVKSPYKLTLGNYIGPKKIIKKSS